MLSLIEPKVASSTGLPEEFTLRLGPRSAEQVAAMARILRDLGADVEVARDGSLLAVRPEA